VCVFKPPVRGQMMEGTGWLELSRTVHWRSRSGMRCRGGM